MHETTAAIEESEVHLTAAEDRTVIAECTAVIDESVVHVTATIEESEVHATATEVSTTIAQGTVNLNESLTSNVSVSVTSVNPEPNQLADSENGTADIGRFINATMSNQEVDNVIKSMPRGTKYMLLTQHFDPPYQYKFPQAFDNGCYRSFHWEYTNNRPWLKYSPYLYAAFCVPCALFVNDRSNKHSLVTTPFKKWVRYTDMIVKHAEKPCHRDAMLAAKTFCDSIETPTSTIRCLFNTERSKHIQEKRNVLKVIAKAVLYCGHQCIALRGDKEKLDQPGNPGNFLALLKLMSESDPLLHEHLNTGRVTYVSPQSENEMIEVIGKQFIQAKRFEEIAEAKY